MLQSNIISNLNKTLRSNFASPLDGSGGGGPVVNRYAQFNGTTDYATIPAVTYSVLATTVMIRCKLDVATPAAPEQTGLFEWGDALEGSATHYPYTSGVAYINCMRTTREDAITLSALVDREEWHWVIVRDSTADGWEFLQAKDDGTLFSLRANAQQAWGQPSTRLIGVNAAACFFQGGTDRFIVIEARLSDAEIQAIIAGGNPSSAMVRFEFEEISSGDFLDDSGNGKDAVITGSPTIETE